MENLPLNDQVQNTPAEESSSQAQDTSAYASAETVPVEPVLPVRRNWWQKLIGWQHAGLLVILLITLGLHFGTILNPNSIVWDETWYVNDARSIIKEQQDLRPEHPPLGKLGTVAGILVFGDNSFGWRFFPVILGTGSIALFYFICRKLEMSQRATLLATFLFGFENMSFIIAGLALLDVYMVFFMLLGFLLYLHRLYVPAVVALVFSVLAKLTGAYFFIAIALHWMIFRRDKPLHVALALPVTALVYAGMLTLMDFPMHHNSFMSPITRSIDMLKYTAANIFTDPPLSISSKPWMWISPDNIIIASYKPQYNLFISWTVQLLVIPAFGYMIYRTIRKVPAAQFALVWFFCSYLIWIPVQLASNRVTFVFYFYPAIAAVCIAIALGIMQLWESFANKRRDDGKLTKGAKWTRGGVWTYLSLHLVIFLLFNPLMPILIPMWLAPFFAP
jgi:dolichyl-phosphate-mannose-protein mannosyltransferase